MKMECNDFSYFLLLRIVIFEKCGQRLFEVLDFKETRHLNAYFSSSVLFGKCVLQPLLLMGTKNYFFPWLMTLKIIFLIIMASANSFLTLTCCDIMDKTSVFFRIYMDG